MGQYYLIVNVNKCQYLHPHQLGDGLKLMEFGLSGCGTMAALAILLADSNGRGGGDLMGMYDPIKGTLPVADPYKLIGSWAGDAIVVTGDYGDAGKLYHTAPADKVWLNEEGEPCSAPNLYDYARKEFCNISEPTKTVLCEDGYCKGEMDSSWSEQDPFDPTHRFAPEGPQAELPLDEPPRPVEEIVADIRTKEAELAALDAKPTADEIQAIDDEVRAEDDKPEAEAPKTKAANCPAPTPPEEDPLAGF